MQTHLTACRTTDYDALHTTTRNVSTQACCETNRCSLMSSRNAGKMTHISSSSLSSSSSSSLFFPHIDLSSLTLWVSYLFLIDLHMFPYFVCYSFYLHYIYIYIYINIYIYIYIYVFLTDVIGMWQSGQDNVVSIEVNTLKRISI